MKALALTLVASTALITGSSAFALALTQPLPEHVLLNGGYTLAKEQVFTFRQGDDWGTIDPGLVQDSIGFDAIRQLFEGLYTQDNSGNLVPALALEMDVSDDKKTYTFNLRRDAKWSDGRPVTAHDFEYAWKRVADPKTGSEYASYISLMSLANADDVISGKKPVNKLGVKALDDYTLQAVLSKPIPYFQ